MTFVYLQPQNEPVKWSCKSTFVYLQPQNYPIQWSCKPTFIDYQLHGNIMLKAHFIGRQEELKRLLETTQKHTASFIVIKGRRRIGKSRLVDEFSKHFEHYYKFTGLAPEKNVENIHQLDEFSRQISRQFQSAKAKYDDWSDALWALGALVKTGKILIFFDELSWMADKDPTFLGKIKNFWDDQLSKNRRLIFIACSSASAWLEKNLLSSTAFVGRVSLTLKLEALPLSDCNQFWPHNISSYEKFKILSVTGGVPKYLEEINIKESAEHNIKRLCFTEGGFLVKEFDNIFSDLFLRKSIYYKKIVTLLSEGIREQSEIQSILCKTSESDYFGRIPEYLWELEEAGFIKRDYTWDIKTGEDSKLSKFRLHDNYLRFYIKYIEKNLKKISRGDFMMKSLTSLTEWNTIMGYQFENLVLNNRISINHILGILPSDVVTGNPFFQKKTGRLPGCQIDYMVQTTFGSLYICEIKFCKNAIGSSVIQEVQKKIESLKFPKGFSYRPVLIHVNGVTEEVVDSNYFFSIINFSDFLV